MTVDVRHSNNIIYGINGLKLQKNTLYFVVCCLHSNVPFPLKLPCNFRYWSHVRTRSLIISMSATSHLEAV